ncbi:5130_t:CDS:2 [Paraglomus occultum]|uniref:5130_t:CDS:1 n=1 Tax=Paraglomus occultum TaxID=144539 RepID=A0A9N9FR41_9GLOM|nr:5130_t:CDS:2 [Paraglomus occultum]
MFILFLLIITAEIVKKRKADEDELSGAERECEPRKQCLAEALETEQQALNLLCHRPLTHCGRQITWYHQAFWNFVRHSTDQNIQLSKISYDASVELCEVMAKMYKGGNDQCQVLESVLLQEFELEFAEFTLSNQSRPDGITIIICESKNEIEGSTMIHISRQRAHTLNSGASQGSMLYGQRATVLQCCSAQLDHDFAYAEQCSLIHNTIMEALKTAYNDLAEYYNALGQSEQMLAEDIDTQRFYPDIRRFKDVNGKDCTKPYQGQTEDGQEIVVKFTMQYNEAAHELCAKDNLAPKLLGVEEVSKGLKVIIMEYVQNTTKACAEKRYNVPWLDMRFAFFTSLE